MDAEMKNKLPVKFSEIKKAYMLGIGGAGVSALAQLFNSFGISVFGSDTSSSVVTEALILAGIKVFIGQDINLIPSDTDLIVYTSAISDLDDITLKKVKALKIPSLSYHQALGFVSKNFFTIAVSGTHGKTTTTAMLGCAVRGSGIDASILVGGTILKSQSSFLSGKSQYLIVEADEYRRGFLYLSPKILVITNIDKDHLDYYKDISDIQNAFCELAKKVPNDGAIVTNTTLSNLGPILECATAPIFDYSSVEISSNDIPFPGNHNVENAKAALLTASLIGVDEKKAREALRNFGGVQRRFEIKGKTKNGAIVIDDYAHNPIKVKSALLGAKQKFPHAKIIAVFQPHLYSRTKLLLDEFSKSFNSADYVILLPIYAAREKEDFSINSDILRDHLLRGGVNVVCVKSFDEASNIALSKAQSGDIIMTIGAGTVTNISKDLLEH